MSLDAFGFSAVRPKNLHVIKSRRTWDGGRISATYACGNSASSVRTTQNFEDRGIRLSALRLGLKPCERCVAASQLWHGQYDWQRP